MKGRHGIKVISTGIGAQRHATHRRNARFGFKCLTQSQFKLTLKLDFKNIEMRLETNQILKHVPINSFQRNRFCFENCLKKRAYTNGEVREVTSFSQLVC